jgi:hypothetical protein
MLVVNRRRSAAGAAMMVVFFAVLAVMFSPAFGGQNAFRAADALFNSIAKGSSYAIPRLRAQGRHLRDTTVEVSLRLRDPAAAAAAERLLDAAGGRARANGPAVELRGELSALVEVALDDADAMFRNDGESLRSRYGVPGKEALRTWWSVLREMHTELESRKLFAEASFVDEVRTRAVEMSYNFSGIEPTRARDHLGALAFSLLFYVAYTLWWGYAIMLVCDGFGLEMKPAKKREA